MIDGVADDGAVEAGDCGTESCDCAAVSHAATSASRTQRSNSFSNDSVGAGVPVVRKTLSPKLPASAKFD
jgi:hypothetical protein